MLRSASASHVVSARWSEQPEQPTAILQTLIYPLVGSQNKWFISDDWTLGFRFGSKADLARMSALGAKLPLGKLDISYAVWLMPDNHETVPCPRRHVGV
jgi:hypothetical protein